MGGGEGGGSDVTWTSLDSSTGSRTGIGESTPPVQHSRSERRQAVSIGLSTLCICARLALGARDVSVYAQYALVLLIV